MHVMLFKYEDFSDLEDVHRVLKKKDGQKQLRRQSLNQGVNAGSWECHGNDQRQRSGTGKVWAAEAIRPQRNHGRWT